MPWTTFRATLITTGIAMMGAGLMPVSLSAQEPAAVSAAAEGRQSAPMRAEWFEGSSAQWVWPEASSQPPNQYAQFIQDFTLSGETAGQVQIAISADSDYAVWVNGQFAGCGQWANFPNDKTYDLIDISELSTSGENRLAVLGYWQGESSSTYRPGDAGLVFAVAQNGNVVAASGDQTRQRPAPDYVSGRVPKVTGQLGFTFEHHGDKGDGWTDRGYNVGAGWTPTGASERKALSERPVRPRPIARLLLEERLPMKVISQGTFIRTRPEASTADAMHSDALALRTQGQIFHNPQQHLRDDLTTGISVKPEALKDATGVWLMLDVGFEEAGLLDLELDAPRGTRVEVGYGEHLEDLRVRTSVGGRQFAVSHTTPEGHHSFMQPFLRLAGRYLQVHLIPPAELATTPTIILKYAGLRPTPYPVERRGVFETSDTLHNKIWEVSRRTLELCMHDHYEDCPWREQALYSMDGRNQALAGYYCFGNYDFARESIKLLGQGYNEQDGLLELCAPADVAVNIPSFSLAWIMMLDDYMLFSGDREFAKSELPLADKLLTNFEKHTSGPLLKTPSGPRMWNFYEWMPGLDGAGVGGRNSLDPARIEAPLNLFYILALESAGRIADGTGGDGEQYRRRAAAVRDVFAATFWDAEKKAFLTAVNHDAPPHYAELTQALAILAEVVPEAELDGLRARLAAEDNGLVPVTISHTMYKFEALLTDRERFATRVFDLIARDWGYMLNQGATSFWETIDGASAFADAGSLCHGWSGVPAWFYGAYILGIKPTSPGFETYAQDPIKSVFTSARGSVPTPNRDIRVEWQR